MATKSENAQVLKIVAPGKAKKVGRHTRIMMKALEAREDIDRVKKEMLLGLTRAWDQIEETRKGVHTIPSISKELREIWATCELPEQDDIFE